MGRLLGIDTLKSPCKRFEHEKKKGRVLYFFKLVANRLVGLSGSYVDDLVLAGALNFHEDSN
jgi:hypothetical protein